jgi:predicted metal-dependent hydrolase
MGEDRRSFLRFAAGIGLGVVAAETYERLYNIPSLQRRFRDEVTYWLNEYNSAKEMLEKLSQQFNVSRDKISRLSAEMNNWKNQYNTAKQEVDRLSSIVDASDAFEKESTAAISFYRERMEEARRALQNTIEKYRVILGDERVSFESSSLKVLDDLKITQEKLLKVLPYFPLIRRFGYSPSKVVKDKVYSLTVSLEVISPLNTLAEVEVRLVPVEYGYFITRYGMREEDYDKVFPKEEIRSVKIEPRKLEEEMFSIDFEDLKGGREYIVRARVKDVAGNEKIVEVKTSYMRQFENIAHSDSYVVLSPYYLWYRKDFSNWKDGHKYTPLLGEYRSDDPIIMSKHIDWATAYGIDGFLVSWTGYEYGDLKYFDDNFKLFLNNPLSKDVLIAILYESPGRLRTTGNPNVPWEIDASSPENLQTLLSDLEYLSKTYFEKGNYYRINSKPVVYIYGSAGFIGDMEAAINKLREHVKDSAGYELYLISDHAHPYVLPGDNKDWEERARSFDGITSWLGGYSGEGRYLGGSYEAQIEILYSKWGNWANEYRKKLFPFITPEFDGRYVRWGNPNSIPLIRSPQLFEERMNIALKHTHSPQAILVGTWNDFFESTTLEPSREYGFIYLEILKRVLEK